MFGKFFTQQKIHTLARDSAIVFIGTMIANIGSYAYHLVMGRRLGPAGYGELSSILSILYIFTVPLIVGQAVLVKFISAFKAKGEIGQTASLFKKITTAILFFSAVIFPFILLTAGPVSTFLHLSSSVLFTLVYILFVVSLLIVVISAILQGYQRFMWYSSLGALAVVLKLALTFPFLPFGVAGVMSASIVSVCIIYILYLYSIRNVLQSAKKPMNIDKNQAVGFAVPTFLTLLGITSLYSTDIILVRHFFSAADAGLYAALAILGKIIFFASASVSQVMFPVISERTAKGIVSIKLIGISLVSVAAISTILCSLYFLFPTFIVKMLFGNAFVEAGALLGLFGIFLSLFSIGNIISMSCLAIGKTHVWIAAIVCALLQIIGIYILHSTIFEVIVLNIGICLLFVVAQLGYYIAISYEKI